MMTLTCLVMQTPSRRSWLDRLLDTSPRSAARWLARAAGRGAHQPFTAPAWERIISGPLEGREILVDRRANGAWDEMLAGTFDAVMYGLIPASLPPQGGVLWDVGAHMGFHTLGFAAVAGPAGRVIAFEPNPFNRDRLARNLQRNPDLAPRVAILSCALGDREREAAFTLSEEVDSGASSMGFLDAAAPAVEAPVGDGWTRTVVDVRTVDGLIASGAAPAPDVIKVDIEGAEMLLVAGAAATLRRRRPLVLVEAHSARLAAELHGALTGFGYVVEIAAEIAPSRILLAAKSRRGGGSSRA